MTRQPLALPTVDDIEAARERIAGSAIRTPLIELDAADAPARVFLKLENLQPIGSFKLRGAGNAMALADPRELAAGVVTASAGNMAQGVAWNATRRGIGCTVVVPEHAPDTKLAAIRRLGGRIEKVPFERWWEVIETHSSGHPGHFIHPVCDPAVIEGNGTIGLEILEDLPEVDAVVVPFGGGGLICGVAASIRARKPNVRVCACEVETAAPLSAALTAGAPQTVAYRPSFVDGIGSTRVLSAMWPLVKSLVDESIVVSLAEVASAIRLLIERNRVVAEGAGAAPVAAALAGRVVGERIVCVVSGGNIDAAKLARILSGDQP